MSMRVWKAKTKINLGDHLDFVKKFSYEEHTDYDLAGHVQALAIRSLSGSKSDFYRRDVVENPDDYKYTALYIGFKEIKWFIDFFKLDKCRIRIHKQLPRTDTPLHTDDQNIGAQSKADIRLRILTALNGDPDFVYDFKQGSQTKSLTLHKGESIVWDPDTVAHGMGNLTENKTRYSIVQIVRPNAWLQKFITEPRVIQFYDF
jgi:hypothetical protein